MQAVPKWLSITFVSVLILLALAIGLDQTYGAIGKIQGASAARTITITAEGKVTSSPDTAELSASIVNNDTTAQTTQAGIDKKAAQLLSYLEQSGISQSDISTSDYSLYPQYNNANSNNNAITGYSGSETLTAKIHDLTKVGVIIGGITQNGANQIESVNYTFSDPDALREQARQQALTSARQKAQDLANAAGVKIGKLVTFTDESANSTPPIYPMAVGMGGGASPADVSSVPSGTQDIVEDVSVTYQIK